MDVSEVRCCIARPTETRTFQWRSHLHWRQRSIYN